MEICFLSAGYFGVEHEDLLFECRSFWEDVKNDHCAGSRISAIQVGLAASHASL